ncbi:MAG: tetratricopeptide repeat protein [Bacteroidales bacterium]
MQLNILIRRLSVIVLSLISLLSSANERRIDSLLQELKKANHDTVAIQAYINLAAEYVDSEPSIALDWLNNALNKTSLCKDSIQCLPLCFYRGKVHIEIAKVYIAHNRHLENAQAHADTATMTLNRMLENNPSDWCKQNAHKELSVAYSTLGRIGLMHGNLDKAIERYTKAHEHCLEVGDEYGVARMNNNLGVLHRRKSNYAQSLNYFQDALGYFKSNNDTVAIASVLTNIGATSYDIGVYDKALENYLNALAIFEKFDDLESLASTLINIGQIFGEIKNETESIPYFRRALSIYREKDDDRGLATCYLSLGYTYLEMNVPDSSQYYLEKSRDTFSRVNDKVGKADALQSLGELYLLQKKYDKAKKTFQQARSMAMEIGFNSVVIYSNHQLAIVELELGNADEALTIALDALEDSKRSSLLKLQQSISKTLSNIYQNLGDYKTSLYYYKHFSSLSDSILSQDRTKRFAEMEVLYQLEQKKAEILKLEQEKDLREIELKNSELRFLWQRTQTFIVLGVLIFLTAILYMVYRQFRIKRSSNYQLMEQNAQILQKNEEILAQKEEIIEQRNEMEKQKKLITEKSEQLEKFNWLITESIDYASSIQAAVMPSEEVFSDYFEDHFIMLFPKDVVSGDFFWAYPKNETIIVAVADCTGHGVPGGFMSMLAISALTELMGRQVYEPSDILNSLRLVVVESLKQSGKVGDHHEGLDISIIRYTKGNDYIEFSGANHPLWIIRDNGNAPQLNVYKGDRMPISFHRIMRPFESHKIPIRKGDRLYLFTDGLRHQLGGDDFSKKYGKERFSNLLLKNAHKPMDDQKSIVEDAFFRWVSGFDQLDDITIMGLKI